MAKAVPRYGVYYMRGGVIYERSTHGDEWAAERAAAAYTNSTPDRHWVIDRMDPHPPFHKRIKEYRLATDWARELRLPPPRRTDAPKRP